MDIRDWTALLEVREAQTVALLHVLSFEVT